MGEEIKQVDNLISFDSLFEYAVSNPDLEPMSRRLLLAKLSHVSDPKQEAQRGVMFKERENYEAFIQPFRDEFLSETSSHNQRLSMLQSLLRLQIYDAQILNKTADLIALD